MTPVAARGTTNIRGLANVSRVNVLIGDVMERRHHDRLLRPGRRQNDRRIPTLDTRRVLLLGPEEAWRLLTAYEFRESGYTVYAAADLLQAVALTARLLPDVVVIQQATPDTLAILA